MNSARIVPQPASTNGGDSTFEIELIWSEKALTVQPGTTALQALIEAGLPITPGCLSGSCGECVMDYVEGDIIHKDSCLSAHDREHRFCPCVSRAHTRIVIAA